MTAYVTEESQRLLVPVQELRGLFPQGGGLPGAADSCGAWLEGKGAECECFRALSCLSTRWSLFYFLPQDARGSGWAPGVPEPQSAWTEL